MKNITPSILSLIIGFGLLTLNSCTTHEPSQTTINNIVVNDLLLESILEDLPDTGQIQPPLINRIAAYTQSELPITIEGQQYYIGKSKLFTTLVYTQSVKSLKEVFAISNFKGLYLPNSNFRNKYLADAVLDYSNFSNSDFRKADITNTNLTTARLTNCDFTKAVMERAYIAGANLSYSKLESTNMSKCVYRRISENDPNGTDVDYWAKLDYCTVDSLTAYSAPSLKILGYKVISNRITR